MEFSLSEGKYGHVAVNLVGAHAVSFIPLLDLSRDEPIASLVAALAIAARHMRVRVGRTRGIRDVAAEAEND